MINWESIINNIDAEKDSYDFFDQFMNELETLFPVGNECDEVSKLKKSVIENLNYTLNNMSKISHPDQQQYESEMYAAMIFIRFHLKKRWEPHWIPLPIEYLQILAYMFVAGQKIGEKPQTSP